MSGAAVSWFVVFLLSVSVIQGQNDWGVTYTSTQICALNGSSVEINCTYRYPSRINDRDTTAEKTSWFTKFQDKEPVDLRTDSEYAGRLQYSCYEKSCTLRITDLRESDSAEYKFRFMTNQPGGSYTGSPGVTLSVTGFQVQMNSSTPCYTEKCTRSQVKCQSSCRLTDCPSYIWYKNGHKIQKETSSSYSDYFYPADSISCAVQGHEDFPSPPVCVHGHSCSRATYTDRSICAFKGSSVDISCTYYYYYYNYYDKSTLWFSPERSHQWQNPSQPQDLSKDSQYAGRVQVLDTERGRSTLRITDLRESDSAKYVFKFKTGSFEWSSSLPGTTLTVTDAPMVPLVLMSPPGDIMKDSSVSLTCSSDAHPAAKYTWYKKNKTLLNNGPQLFFNVIQSSDSGEYYCTAENELGKMTSEYAFVNVKYGPRTSTLSMSPGEIVEGSSVNLTCSSDANPAANYTWYKENQKLLQGPEGIYHFTSITSEDSGVYYCKSENQYRQINSTLLLLDVQYAPKLPSVSVSPSAEIVEGSSVTLTCSSDANPAANYTWYKENEDSPKASGQNFTITDFRAEHIGNYYCEAQNRRGRHYSALHLTVVAMVHSPWGVTYTSTEICALKGSTVDINCTYRYPSTINPVTRVEKEFWFTKESNNVYVDLRMDPEYSDRVQYICDENRCTLRIRDLRESDSAEYKFRFITNQPGGNYTGSPGVTLSVTGLQVQVSRSTVYESSTWGNLKCHSSCLLPGHPYYVWHKKGQKIQKATSSYSDNICPADSYSCAVKGHEDFPSPSVLVHSPWGVTYTSTEICAFKGSTVDIHCIYTYPPRQYDHDTIP